MRVAFLGEAVRVLFVYFETLGDWRPVCSAVVVLMKKLLSHCGPLCYLARPICGAACVCVCVCVRERERESERERERERRHAGDLRQERLKYQ